MYSSFSSNYFGVYVMTDEQIIEMARKTNLGDTGLDVGFVFFHIGITNLKAFAKLVAQHEREECAKVCEAQLNEGECPERAQYCADAIRARGEA